MGPRCRGNDRAWVSRGRGRHHRGLEDLRRKGDAGNGQKGGVVRRYFGNGAEVGKGWLGGLRPGGLPANLFQDASLGFRGVIVLGLALCLPKRGQPLGLPLHRVSTP